MKEYADVVISIVTALGLREGTAYVVRWYRDNKSEEKNVSTSVQAKLEEEIEVLRAKVEIIQQQMSQTQQRNVKLETAIHLSMSFIERINPESAEIINDIKKTLES